MKRFLFLLIFTFQMLSTNGQIAVESFRLLETDLTAITHGTQEIDQNGEVAALIKIVTTQRGFTFDGGMLGIVKTVLKPAEYWVYVPRKLQKITIAHPDLGILRDYYFQIPIEGGRTYELRLLTGQVGIGGGKARTTQYLTIKVTPPNATVFVDDELQSLNSEGAFFKLMSIGKHSYRAEATGYRSESGVVELGREKAVLNITLKSAKSTLTIHCDDPEADIVLNEEVKGKVDWTGTVLPGLYVVEARRFGYYTSFEEIEIRELENRTITVSSPVPICGNMRIESNPMGAAVYVDNKYYDDTPCLIDESAGLVVGEHQIKIMKEGYLAFSTIVMLQAEEEYVLTDINLKLEEKTPKETGKPEKKRTEREKKNEKKEKGRTEKYDNVEVIMSEPENTTLEEPSGISSMAEEESIPSIKDEHGFVDLGLPSGTLWATCNIGASSPSELGDFFAWGETSTKKVYSWRTLKYCISGDSYDNVKFSKYVTQKRYGDIDDMIELTLSDDAARQNWGHLWRMPTHAEWMELREHCIWKWTSLDGHNGFKVTSKSNGNFIFLPASGRCLGMESSYMDKYGRYWSSSLYENDPCRAWFFGFSFESVEDNSYSNRVNGHSIRPVFSPDSLSLFEGYMDTPTIEEKPTLIINGHEYVDLGLSSGILWATCNIGASSPEGYGNYYAWGETSSKEEYTWSNLNYCSNSFGNVFTKYFIAKGNETIRELESMDDAASVNWGEGWHIPSNESWQEIFDFCEWKWSNQDGHVGYRIIGPNGNSIFLPAAGYRDGKELNNVERLGYYWSSSLHESNSKDAWGLYFGRIGIYQNNAERYQGRSIRPVHHP